MDNVQQLPVIIHAQERCAVINTYNPRVVLRPCGRSVRLSVALSCVSFTNRPGVTIFQSLQWLSYGLDDRGIGVWFATGLRSPPPIPSLQTCYGGHSVLCSVNTWGPSSRDKAAYDCSCLSVTQVRNIGSCTSTRPYVFIAKCLIKHTNVLNVTLHFSTLHGMHCSALTRVFRFPCAFESVLPKNTARISELSVVDSREFPALCQPTITRRGRWTTLYWITL